MTEGEVQEVGCGREGDEYLKYSFYPHVLLRFL